MNIIKDWGLLRAAHKVIDGIFSRGEEEVGEAYDKSLEIQGRGIPRRDFLKYVGIGVGALAIAPRLFLPKPPSGDVWGDIVNDPEFHNFYDPIAAHAKAMKGWYMYQIQSISIVNSKALVAPSVGESSALTIDFVERHKQPVFERACGDLVFLGDPQPATFERKPLVIETGFRRTRDFSA